MPWIGLLRRLNVFCPVQNFMDTSIKLYRIETASTNLRVFAEPIFRLHEFPLGLHSSSSLFRVF